MICLPINTPVSTSSSNPLSSTRSVSTYSHRRVRHQPALHQAAQQGCINLAQVIAAFRRVAACEEDNGTMDELLDGIGEWIGSILNHSTGITVTIQILPLSGKPRGTQPPAPSPSSLPAIRKAMSDKIPVHPAPWTPLRAHYHLADDETGAQHWFVLVAEDDSVSEDEGHGDRSWSVGYLDPYADR